MINGDEQLVGEVSVRADRHQRRRLLAWTAEFEPRLWAVEGATGVGALLAQQLVGYTGDVRRFPTSGHYARYDATAPIEASSGPKKRHRLNPKGNRQLNHAIHIAALAQISHDTPGRAYYLAKQAAGKSRKEAIRCLKRRISDAIYRHLIADATG